MYWHGKECSFSTAPQQQIFPAGIWKFTHSCPSRTQHALHSLISVWLLCPVRCGVWTMPLVVTCGPTPNLVVTSIPSPRMVTTNGGGSSRFHWGRPHDSKTVCVCVRDFKRHCHYRCYCYDYLFFFSLPVVVALSSAMPEHQNPIIIQ